MEQRSNVVAITSSQCTTDLFNPDESKHTVYDMVERLMNKSVWIETQCKSGCHLIPTSSLYCVSTVLSQNQICFLFLSSFFQNLCWHISLCFRAIYPFRLFLTIPFRLSYLLSEPFSFILYHCFVCFLWVLIITLLFVCLLSFACYLWLSFSLMQLLSLSLARQPIYFVLPPGVLSSSSFQSKQSI